MPTYNGTDGNDSIVGSASADTIFGGGGDDTLNGGAGQDLIYGGTGSDSIKGLSGNDTIYGGGGLNDLLYGEGGDDYIYFEADAGGAYGGAGNDYIYAKKTAGTQIHLYGGDGNDTLAIDLTNSNSWVHRDGHHAFGGRGDDKFVFENPIAASGMLIGRIDDFDNSRDSIWLGDMQLNLRNLPNGVRIVQHLGQQWILFSNKAAYALEGARKTSGDNEEDHFPDGQFSISLLNSLPSVTYIDQLNYVPRSLYEAVEGSLNEVSGSGAVINGTATADRIYDESGNSGTIYGGAGGDVIDSNGGRDTVYGGADNDMIAGGLDDDTLYGGSGNDTVYGGSEDDSLIGEDGHDVLYGGTGIDTLSGGIGNDILLGGDGADQLDGGAGTDRAQYSLAIAGVLADLQNASLNTGEATGDTYVSIENLAGSNFNDDLRGDAQNNAIWGWDGGDALYGRDGNDSLSGDDGNDTLNGGAGADRLDGGAGTDRAQYSNATGAVLADLQNASLNTGEAAGDTYVSIENLHGSKYNDDLRGDAENNMLWGWDGNDTLYGRDGNDTLLGGAGADRLDGGAGTDRAQYNSATAAILVDFQNVSLNTGEAAGDVYVSIENLLGTNYEDDLRGDAQANYIWGAAGNDILTGRDGNDTLSGDDGNDNLIGGNGADSLLGGTGNDSLSGGVGADTLNGGAGKDTLYGGAADGERDVFVFSSTSDSNVGSNRDIVYDFVSGIDDFDFRSIDANTAVAGDQAFIFSGTTAAANSIWFVASGSNLSVWGDNNGDTTADFEIVVAGLNTLVASDFLL